MAKKTVLKRLLSNFGVISIDQQSLELATALQADQAVITEDGFRYVDNEHGEEKIVPFSDVLNLPQADEPDDSADDDKPVDDIADTDNADTDNDSEEKHD